MTCPDRDELARYRERELPERRADDVREHVAGCPACTRALAQLEQRLADLAAPIAASDPRAERAAVLRVMAHLDDAARPTPRHARAWLGAGGFALAAACAAIWIAARHPASPSAGADGDGFTARGAGPLPTTFATARDIERAAGISLFALAAPGASGTRALADGALVHADTAYVAGYRDLAAPPSALYALVFAVDSAGDVHWLYPAFTDATTDPLAAALAPTAERDLRLFPDSVVLDAVPTGALRVVSVIAAEPLHVSAIERLHGDSLALPALRRRFAAASIAEVHLEVRP